MILVRCLPITLPLLFSLAYLLTPAPMPIPDDTTLDPAEKERIIQKVFDDLLEAIGEADRPTLEFKVGIGTAEYSNKKVYVDLKLFDLCSKRFGPNAQDALAWVLSHELAHHYSVRRKTQDVLAKGWKEARGKVVPNIEAQREAQADYFAGFYGRLAGYDVLGKTRDILEMLYNNDSLPYHMLGYPTLGERKLIAGEVKDSLERLIPMFDIANYLALVCQYPEAQRCYEHVIATFPSRELLNNTGVVCMLQALDLMGGSEAGYVYPLELDADTRLGGISVTDGNTNRATRGPKPGSEQMIQLLLDKAERYFNDARERDKQYATALVNLATVYILRQDYAMALKIINNAMRLEMAESVRARLSLVQGIAHMLNNNGEKARQSMDAAREYADGSEVSSLVEANAAIMEKRTFNITKGRGSTEVETIDGVSPIDTILTWRPFLRYLIDGKYAMDFRYREYDGCSLLFANKDASWVQFVSTRNSYREKTSKDIGLGDPIDLVKKLYGQEPRIIHARRGSYYVYDFAKIIFFADENGRVQRWIVYTME